MIRYTVCPSVCPSVSQIETVSELSEEVVVQKLRQSGGAHAPTGYEFSNYSS